MSGHQRLRTTCGVLVLCCLTTVHCLGQAQPGAVEGGTLDKENSTVWYDVQQLPIEGQAWDDTESPYDRLPARAKDVVRPAVWNLARQSAGIAVSFDTDSPSIAVKWSLTSSNLAMPHMPATGVSGLDLYVRSDGQWRWLACGRPEAQQNLKSLVSGITAERRAYLLYLPLYNGVSSVEIGIASGSTLYRPAPRPASQQKPIVFYGTSITQGGCASRPGMVHTAILGRWLDRPVVNLGFSGNGRMETEVVQFIAEIDASVFVIDCLPNITADAVEERTDACIALLRAKHPHTPILLVEDRSYSDSFLVTAKRDRNRSSRAALRRVFERQQAAGTERIYYLEGQQLLGDDNEGTVDSSHPTDLGFMRQAEAFRAILQPLLVDGH